MKELIVFGKNSIVQERKSDIDSIEHRDNKIIIQSHKKPGNLLLKEHLTDLLYSKLYKIYDQIKSERKIDIFGNLDFEVVENIDNKKQRIARLKGNKILVKLNAVALPHEALRYVVAHEIAHTYTKKHTKKFWKIVETIYPDLETGQNLLEKYKQFLAGSLNQSIAISE